MPKIDEFSLVYNNMKKGKKYANKSKIVSGVESNQSISRF